MSRITELELLAELNSIYCELDYDWSYEDYGKPEPVIQKLDRLIQEIDRFGIGETEE
jgi:hypothetical protein